MASEDSDQLRPGLPVIHRLRDLRDLDQSFPGQVLTRVDLLHAKRKSLEVLPLRSAERIRSEERDDVLQELRARFDDELQQVFLVIVVPTVDVNASNPKELLEFPEAARTTFALRHDESVNDLIAGSVAASGSAGRLPHEAD